jgi:hypothetical protein
MQRLDPRALPPHFHQPALMITPRDVVSLPTAAAVEQAYAPVMAGLPAQGYARTEFPQLAAHRLSDDLVVVSGLSVWTKESGEELQRFGMNYTLRRTELTWRIVVAMIHDPTAVVRFP